MGRSGRGGWRALVAVLAAAGLAGCSAASGAATGSPPAGSSPAAGEPTAEPQASVDAGPGSPVAVFLGDSYTVGLGGQGYVTLAAEELGWSARGAGQSGTGYVARGVAYWMEPFGGRVDEVAAARPDVVVVQGSTNDVGQAPDEVRAAAADLFAELAQALPDSRLVVVGPVAAPVVDPAGVRAIRDAVRDSAVAAGLPFVDPVAEEWLQPSDGLFADGLHPDDDGYAQMAAELAAALAELGF
ncbi:MULTISPECIES: SGNH/GDSL hydrolase family protein [unclassified Blastococcus]